MSQLDTNFLLKEPNNRISLHGLRPDPIARAYRCECGIIFCDDIKDKAMKQFNNHQKDELNKALKVLGIELEVF